MEEAPGLLGKIVPFLVVFGIMALQAWLRVKKQQREQQRRTPAPEREAPSPRREPARYNPAKRQEWSRPAAPNVEQPRDEAPAAPVAEARDDSPIPVGAASSALSQRRSSFVFNRGKLREAILHREILTPRHF